jgi:hypothetical protein
MYLAGIQRRAFSDEYLLFSPVSSIEERASRLLLFYLPCRAFLRFKFGKGPSGNL